MWQRIKQLWAELVAWWKSDAVSSKVIRVPFKLSIVAGAAVVALAFGLYGAGKVSAYMGDNKPATAVQLTEFRSQLMSAIAECKPPAKVTPAKKSAKR